MKIDIEITEREDLLLFIAMLIFTLGFLSGYLLAVNLSPGAKSAWDTRLDQDQVRKPVLGFGWTLNESCTKWLYVNGSESVNCDDPWRYNWEPGKD